MGVRVAERSRSHGSTLTTKIMARISKKRKDALAKFDRMLLLSLTAKNRTA
jgi:uncharacterized protein YqeY